MRFQKICANLLALFLTSATLTAQSPAILGKGTKLLKLGPLLASDDFDNLDNWVIQVQPGDKAPAPSVVAKNNTLDCYLPDRGCTIWFKKKLRTRVTISYDVLCPTPKKPVKNLLPRDINNFWMASDPEGKLFDSGRFTGNFGTYHKMNGYYASTGGGKNTTTRMRRYPREVDGKPAEHLALTSRDKDPDFLITPDKLMRVQLVAYDDLIQYIVDGKLVYEVSHGDEIQIEDPDRKHHPADYTPERFPTYQEGYFGFRMVGTHHIYSNFRVHSLEPVKPKVTVKSIKELREAVAKDHQRIVMKPGTYEITNFINGRTGFEISGSHLDLDLTGVTINTPISLLSNPRKGQIEDRRRRRRGRSYNVVLVSGDHVTIKGGTFDNPHPLHDGSPIDFGSYNQDPSNFPAHAMTEIRLSGDDIRMTDCKVTVRGSSPYGYGNIYGIGGGSVVSLNKHSGILMTGDRITLERCFVKMESFGHAIFVQGGDDITVRHCEVQGEVRPSNDLYKEINKGDLPKKFGYKMQWPNSIKGLPIPKDHMLNLVEDGIRAYSGTGRMTVEHCKVNKVRGGIKLYMAKSATISDCEATDCVIQGFSIPSRGTITRSKGNAAYGPLLYVHSNNHSSQKIDLEVLPAPHALGDHPLAAINGKRHQIQFTASEPFSSNRPIILGYPVRFDFLSKNYPGIPEGYEAHFKKANDDDYQASDISLSNKTNHPVVTGKRSEDNEISSVGKVRDLGTDNSVMPLPKQAD